MLAGETVFEPDCADPELLAWRAGEMAAELGFRMRKEGFGARVVTAKLVYTDGSTVSRSVRAGQGASFVADIQLCEAAERVVRQAWERRVRVRKLQIELGGFEPEGPELDLFEPPPFFRAKPEIDSTGLRTRRIAMHMRLQSTLDRVHDKYGQSSIVPAKAFLYREGSLAC
jgi:hypothetical protein